MDKKYTSLEHSIRNIMTESIGAIGTDKFTKTGNSFFRAFHAEPKKGDTHPNGNAVRAARNVSKERTSTTMSEEEQLVELKKIDLEIMTKGLAPPTKAPTIPTPKTEPITPKPEPEVTPKPKEVPVEKPKTTEEPTTTNKPKPGTKIKPEEGASSKSGPKPAEGEPPKPKGETPSKTKVKDEKTPKRIPFPIISFPLAVNPLMGPFGGAHVRTVMHSPEERLGESTDADKIRQSIENVARPGGKNRITKQAELKAKIIENNNRKANIVRDAIKQKKAGQNPLVDMNPKLKGLELDEKYLGRKLKVGATTGAMGVGGAAGVTGGVEKSQRTMDSQTQYDQESGQINPEKSSFAKFLDKYNPLYDPEKAKTGPTGVDYALDAGQMAVTPFITVPSGAAAVYRDLQRGDYTDSVLDAIGMVPAASEAIKAPAWIASKVGGLVSKVPGLFSSGKKIASTAEKLKSSRIANPKQYGVRDISSTASSGAELGNLGRQFTNVAGERAKENNSSTAQELPGVVKDYGKVWASETQQGAKDIYKNVLDYAKKIK